MIWTLIQPFSEGWSKTSSGLFGWSWFAEGEGGKPQGDSLLDWWRILVSHVAKKHGMNIPGCSIVTEPILELYLRSRLLNFWKTWQGISFFPKQFTVQAGVSLGQASVLAAGDRCQMEYKKITVYCWGSQFFLSVSALARACLRSCLPSCLQRSGMLRPWFGLVSKISCAICATVWDLPWCNLVT